MPILRTSAKWYGTSIVTVRSGENGFRFRAKRRIMYSYILLYMVNHCRHKELIERGKTMANKETENKSKRYYEKSAKQPIDVMREIMTDEQFEGFLMGNIIKYRMRAKYKGDYDGDMEKANVYSHWLKSHRKGLAIELDNVLNDKLTYLGIGMCNYDF